MTHTILFFMVAVDLSLSLASILLLKSTLTEERDRTDRYASALLAVGDEVRASRSVAPPARNGATVVSGPTPAGGADGRVAPRQIGLKAR